MWLLLVSAFGFIVPNGLFLYWVVVLSIIGGLAFSLPLYWWMNERRGFVRA